MAITDNNPIPLVTDVATASKLIDWAVKSIGGGFHPDERADDYIQTTAGAADYVSVFDTSEAIFFDQQIDAAFRILPDIYGTALDALHAENGPSDRMLADS